MPRSEDQEDGRAVFREANARIEQARVSLGLGESPSPYICECPDGRCTTVVLVVPSVYARVRDDDGRHLVAPGHEGEDGIVERAESHSVVEEG